MPKLENALISLNSLSRPAAGKVSAPALLVVTLVYLVAVLSVPLCPATHSVARGLSRGSVGDVRNRFRESVRQITLGASADTAYRHLQPVH